VSPARRPVEVQLLMDLAGIKVAKGEFCARLRKRFGTPTHLLSLSTGYVPPPSLAHSPPTSCMCVCVCVAAEKIDEMPPPEPQLMSVSQCNSFLCSNGLLINKVEFENLFDHFGVGGKENLLVDMDAWMVELRKVEGGEDPIWHKEYPDPSPYSSHLALSGVSHMEFGVQDKVCLRKAPCACVRAGWDRVAARAPEAMSSCAPPPVLPPWSRLPHLPALDAHVYLCVLYVWQPFPKHWGVPPNTQMKGHDGIMRDLPGGYGKGNAPMFNWVQMNMQKDKQSETNVRGEKPYPFGNYSL
jgi:hypothetical protein